MPCHRNRAAGCEIDGSDASIHEVVGEQGRAVVENEHALVRPADIDATQLRDTEGVQDRNLAISLQSREEIRPGRLENRGTEILASS